MKIKVKVKSKSEDVLLTNFLSSDEQLELAHKDYLKKRNEIITKLYTIWRNQEIPTVYRKWISEAARFINEREV